MAVDNTLVDLILLNETNWKIVLQVNQLLKPFNEAQKILKDDKYASLSLLPAALIQIIGAQGGGEAQRRVKNLAEASQYLEGGVVTRGHGSQHVGLHPLAAFASVLDLRTKVLRAY